MRKLPLIIALLLLISPLGASAEMLPLETTKNLASRVKQLEPCDTLHHEQTCDRYHVVGFTAVEVGAELQLDTGTYIIRDLALVNYLDDGTQVSTPLRGLPSQGGLELPVRLKGANGRDAKVVDSRLKLKVEKK